MPSEHDDEVDYWQRRARSAYLLAVLDSVGRLYSNRTLAVATKDPIARQAVRDAVNGAGSDEAGRYILKHRRLARDLVRWWADHTDNKDRKVALYMALSDWPAE